MTRTYRRVVVFVAVIVTSIPLVRAAGGVVTLPKGLPADLWEILIPPDNAVTPEKTELGRRLYYDKRLSADGTVSCATCHDPEKGFADGKKVGEGISGKKGARNSPTVLNSMFNEFQFWDGRAATLEEQAKGPMINPVEMGMKDHGAVVAAVARDPGYAADFPRIFGRAVNIDDIAAAIATFERTVVSGDSAFDRFQAGDKLAMSESAQRGWALWNGKARCNTCHPFAANTPNFSDNKFHNIGIAAKNRDFASLARKAATVENLESLAFDPNFSELGRFIATRQPKDLGAFKSSGLRDIALTAPYMHDGSEPTLISVVEYYNRGGEPNPFLDGGITPLKLTHDEMHDLVAFMESLTGQGEGAANRPQLRDPKK
ncbi:MAG: cytochrome-c peroxidase [Vicinamibacteria bacterium]|nr:cytochrome-c peroxidase [Vicinamibacteria bacterium]